MYPYMGAPVVGSTRKVNPRVGNVPGNRTRRLPGGGKVVFVCFDLEDR